MGWLHVVGDSAIAAAYLSIPALLLYLIGERNDVPFHGVGGCSRRSSSPAGPRTRGAGSNFSPTIAAGPDAADDLVEPEDLHADGSHLPSPGPPLLPVAVGRDGAHLGRDADDTDAHDGRELSAPASEPGSLAKPFEPAQRLRTVTELAQRGTAPPPVDSASG